MSKKLILTILACILSIHAWLAVQGIGWGLPDRWNVDEQTAKSLTLLSKRDLTAVVDTAHPPLYNYLLAAFQALLLAVMKMSGVPLESIAAQTKGSWQMLARTAPGFTVALGIWSRLFTVLLDLGIIALTYKIGRLLFPAPRPALLAAGILAVSTGLVEVSHFAKHTSLVALLTLLSAYFAFRSIVRCQKKDSYIAAAVSGAAAATQADGGFAFLYAAAGAWYWMLLLYREKRPAAAIFRFTAWHLACALAGFTVGWPTIWGTLTDYSGKLLLGFSAAEPSLVTAPLLVNAAEKSAAYGAHVLYVFSPLLGVWVIASALYCLYHWRRMLPFSGIFLFALVPYALMPVFYFTKFDGAYTKLMIHLLPPLSLCAGLILHRVWTHLAAKGHKALAIAGTCLLFTTAIAYALRADRVFEHADTRYALTRWIEQNVGRDEGIAHLQQPDLLFSSRILRTHEIHFLGRNSQNPADMPLYRKGDEELAREFAASLAAHPPAEKYFLVAAGRDFLYEPHRVTPALRNTFLYLLREGKIPGYTLHREFSFPESLLFSPRPAYTAPRILVYKKTPERNTP